MKERADKAEAARADIRAIATAAAAHEARYVAALQQLDELVAASPLAAQVDAFDAYGAAGTRMHGAVRAARVEPDGLARLLDEMGDDAAAARRALPEREPERLNTSRDGLPGLRYGRVLVHLLHLLRPDETSYSRPGITRYLP